MISLALIYFIMSILFLIYSITILMGKDGTMFSLFTKEEKALTKGQKLTIYLITIVLFVASLVWLLNLI